MPRHQRPFGKWLSERKASGGASPGDHHRPSPGRMHRLPLKPFGTPHPLCVHSVGLLLLYGALNSHPFFPSHVASGRCFLLAAAAGAPAGVVSAFAEPSGWCVGAVLDVAGCAVCVSAAPSSWPFGVVLVVAGVV